MRRCYNTDSDHFIDEENLLVSSRKQGHGRKRRIVSSESIKH